LFDGFELIDENREGGNGKLGCEQDGLPGDPFLAFQKTSPDGVDHCNGICNDQAIGSRYDPYIVTSRDYYPGTNGDPKGQGFPKRLHDTSPTMPL
jgi:hypothetical protein